MVIYGKTHSANIGFLAFKLFFFYKNVLKKRGHPTLILRPIGHPISLHNGQRV